MIGWSGILVQVGVAGGFVAFAFAAMGQLKEKRSGVNVLLVLMFTSITVLLLARDLRPFFLSARPARSSARSGGTNKCVRGSA